MRSTHSFLHGISSAILAGALPYFFTDRFVHWHMSHSVIYFSTSPLMSVQYIFWQIIALILTSTVLRRCI